jgi:hypothetical protein
MGSGRTEDRQGEGARRGAGRGSRVLAVLLARDLNPIEEAFSKIKTIVRKVGARTREALVEAIARALAAVTSEDVAGSGLLTLATSLRINLYEYRCKRVSEKAS